MFVVDLFICSLNKRPSTCSNNTLHVCVIGLLLSSTAVDDCLLMIDIFVLQTKDQVHVVAILFLYLCYWFIIEFNSGSQLFVVDFFRTRCV